MQCREAVLLGGSGEIARAMDLLRGAWRRAKNGDNAAGRFSALDGMALVLSMQGAYIESQATAIDAYRIAIALQDKARAVHALTTVVYASAFIMDGNAFLAGILDRCLAEAVTIGEPTLLMHVHNTRALLLVRQRRFDAALEEIAIVRSLLPRTDGTLPESIVAVYEVAMRVRKARVSVGGERSRIQAEAEAAADIARQTATRAGNREALARLDYSLGCLRRQQGRHNEALAALHNALALSHSMKLLYGATIIQLEQAEAYRDLGQFDDALSSYEGAHLSAELCRPCKELHLASKGLADVHELRGDRAVAVRMRDVAEREARQHERECESAQLALNELWREIEKA